MGSDLPPPPPPSSQPPVPPVPPVPPAAPAPPPGPPPVPQPQGPVPQPTQAYPQQPAVPGVAPGEAVPPKKNLTPWLIAAAIAAVAVIVGAVLAFGGGDDDTPTLGGDESTVTVSSVDAPTTVAVTEGEDDEEGSDDTLVITAPETTQPQGTVAPTLSTPTGDGAISVTDDTGTFSVFLPDTFQTDTAPIDAQGVTFAQVSGSDDLQAYVNDHDTFGITVLVAPADQVSAPADLVGAFDPGADVCTQRVPQSGYQTSVGTAELLLLDGCGTGGAFAKVIMVVPVPDQNAVVVAVSQGTAPASGALLDFTQAVVESISAA